MASSLYQPWDNGESYFQNKDRITCWHPYKAQAKSLSTSTQDLVGSLCIGVNGMGRL